MLTALASPGMQGTVGSRVRRLGIRVLFAWVSILGSFGSSESYAADDSPTWIWTPQHEQGRVPKGSVYFRKTFTASTPGSGHIDIAADDFYELYINGKKVATGDAWRRFDRHDISTWLVPGRNVVAVRVTNRENAYAGLAAQIVVRQGAKDGLVRTDHSWRTSVSPLPLWQVAQFNDFRWPRARVMGDDTAGGSSDDGNDGADESSDATESVAANDVTKASDAPQDASQSATPSATSRVTAPPAAVLKLSPFVPVPESAIERPRDFIVEQIDCHAQTGSIIALTFNEFGDIVASQEEGPLLLIHDADGDSVVDSVRTYSDKVKNCQGLLCLSGDVFAVAIGEQGAGLYRLKDLDRDGSAEVAQCLVKFEQEKLEHGAHGLVLGHDGLLYIMLGNHCRVADGYADSSPHKNYYEGDLVQPRYEDPSGHAMGVRAPGGMVVRTDTEGKKVELFAGGLRNPYDLAFNAKGDLFTHDADMESDIGTTWYRPTRVNHVIPGAEFGWRSGWAKWPDYYVDSVPGICDTDRGSPAGLVFYEHDHFPVEYQNVMFSCDWSEGRIWAIKMQPDGASYRASSEVFLKGKPLNATDIEVGPDGGLYMFTGGRGTKTLLYRVRYAGIGPQTKPVNVTPLLSAIRQPQPSSAWSRQRVAAIKQQVGDKWDAELPLLVRDTKATEADRVSALRTMGWYGPPLSKEFLLELSVDKQPAVRAAACTHLGQLESEDAIADRLVELVADGDAHVRRRALESLRRGNYKIATNGLIRSLSTVDRFESWSARRQLETLPADSWYPLILKTDVPREFLQLALARLIVDPNKEFSVEAIARVTELLNEYVSDRDFMDMMRLVQVAMIRGNVTAEDMPRLGEIIAEEFPADNPNMNRELIRILSYLREASIKNRYLKYLDSDLSPADRLHVVAHLRLLGDAWNTEDKVKLLRAIHRDDDEEQSLPPYIQNIGRDLASLLSPDEHRVILAGGSIYPEAALAVLYELPADLSLEQIQELQVLDRRLINVPGPSADRLRAGIVAVLARGADDRAMEYLRYAYDRDVERRPTIAIGLAQNAKGPNWAYLLRSLPVLDEATCREVLQQLSSVAQKPAANDAASVGYYHDVVDVVGKYTGETAEAAIALLEKWQGVPPRGTDVSLPQAVAKWRQWYVQQYPRGPQLASLATATPSQHHTLDSLLSSLKSHPPATSADVQHGAAVFEKAQCGKCHRFGSRGESMGPDLSQVAQRFTQRDLLVSILEPSRAISDQYVSKTLVDASGKSHTGIVGSGGRRDYVVLKSDGTKVRIPREEVEEIVPSTTSVMPSGLLDSLTAQEVYELVAYLSSSSQASHRVAGRAATQSQIKKR